MKLGNLSILVTNFDDCFRFWSEALGAKVACGRPGETYAQFVLPGGDDIAIFDRALVSDAMSSEGLPAEAGAGDCMRIVIEVDSVDDLYKSLTERGVKFTAEPTNMDEWGIRAANLLDPDGTLVELVADL